MKKKIGIVGLGNMGRAIAEQLKLRYQVGAFDKDKEKTQNLAEINAADSIVDLVNHSEIVILAVKPQDFEAVLGEIGGAAGGKLIISIAAGITTSYIESRLAGARVVRAMPNLAARIGRGMNCLSKAKSATQDDLGIAEELFKNLGTTLILTEEMMDAATAIAGSGPGYLYDWAEGKSFDQVIKYANSFFMPALADAAGALGFTAQEARILAEVTTKGAVGFLQESKLSAQELKKQIASPGGTTQAALEVLHKGGSLEEAVKSAVKRARELSRR